MQAIAAFAPVISVIQIGEISHPINGIKSSSAIFKVLRVKPVLGRTFIEEDEQHGSEPVVIIGNQMWRQKLDGAPNVVGQQINIDGKLRTVVGVLPAFDFAFANSSTDFWVPLDPKGEVERQRSGAFLQVIGRLNRDTTLQEAEAEIHEIALREEIFQKGSGDSIGLVQVDLNRRDGSVSGGTEFPARLSLMTLLPVAMLGAIVFIAKRSAPLKELPRSISIGAFQVMNTDRFSYAHKAAPIVSKLAASLVLLAGVMFMIRNFIRIS